MSSAKTVDDYIAHAPEYAQPILVKLRALVREAAPALGEAIKWGSPCYVGKGLVCGFAAFKQHVNFHFFKGGQLADPEGVLTHGEGNASGRAAKFSAMKDIRGQPIKRLLREAVKFDADATARLAPRVRRAELPMPDDLAAAIRQSAKASACWGMLPPSCRREYIEWIMTAKREETRTRRMGEAVKMQGEGRRQNEQYR